MDEEPNFLNSSETQGLSTPFDFNLNFIETSQDQFDNETESTIFQTISARYQKQINCLAVDSTGRFAALGG
jgi:hypothetical protein